MRITQAVNEVVRPLTRQSKSGAPFEQRSHDLGRGIGFDNVARTLETLETLDGPSSS
jgi:hypothetical protein